MSDPSPVIYAYIGPSGSGKTFKALQDIALYKRQIRIDAQPMGNDDVQRGCEVLRNIPDLLAYVKENKDGNFKACLWPEKLDLKTAFHWICKIAITFENIAILADEANRYIDRNLCEAGEAVFFQSRHSKTRLFYTVFNPRYVTPEMRANTFKTHLFKNYEKNVTSYLHDLGATPETVAKFMSDNLPKYSYALIETGKRPVIISPKPPKGAGKSTKTPAKTTARKSPKPAKGGGRRNKK